MSVRGGNRQKQKIEAQFAMWEGNPGLKIMKKSGKILWPKMRVWKKSDYYEVFDANLSLMRNFTFTRAINKYISAFYKVHCKRRMPNEEKGCTWN